MNRFRSLGAALAAMALTFAVVGTAFAANPPGQNKIRCLGDATPSGAQGCVFHGGSAAAYYSTGTGGTFPNAWDKQLDSITQLSFRYAGDAPYGGVPRFSIQIDENGDGSGPEEAYVFVAAADCNDGNGLVDVINDSTCTIYYGANSYANWAAFTAAYPDATLYFAFVVSDQPWAGTISSLKIGKPGK